MHLCGSCTPRHDRNELQAKKKGWDMQILGRFAGEQKTIPDLFSASGENCYKPWKLVAFPLIWESASSLQYLYFPTFPLSNDLIKQNSFGVNQKSRETLLWLLLSIGDVRKTLTGLPLEFAIY